MGYKILSIDGGGIKGVFPASFLATLEETNGIKVAEHFDLIVGTSTGGIIALALGLGFSAKDILSFYEKNGEDVFKGNRFFSFLRHWGLYKYESEPLKKALKGIFGELQLGQSKNRLVIPSFNLDTGEVYVYKTSHHPRLKSDFKEKVVNVALATSAAPTYFPTHKTSSGIPLVDGGIWANNPMGMAAVEAIGVLDWPRDQIKILSIGCTAEPLNTRPKGGKLSWASKIADIFLASQSSASIGTASLLVGKDNVIRIDPSVPRGRFGIDTVKEIEALKGLGATEARKANPDLTSFFVEKAEAFDPCNKLEV